MHFLLHIFCSIIVTTVQYLSPALHKNFTDADFDFKVCDFDLVNLSSAQQARDYPPHIHTLSNGDRLSTLYATDGSMRQRELHRAKANWTE